MSRQMEDQDFRTGMFAAALALAMILTPVVVFAVVPASETAEYLPVDADDELIAGEETVPSFSELDANGDGVISLGEAQAHGALAEVFHEADANGDGVLDRSEFQKALRLIQT